MQTASKNRSTVADGACHRGARLPLFSSVSLVPSTSPTRESKYYASNLLNMTSDLVIERIALRISVLRFFDWRALLERPNSCCAANSL